MTWGLYIDSTVEGSGSIFDSSDGLSGFKVTSMDDTTSMTTSMPSAGWVVAGAPLNFSQTGVMGLKANYASGAWSSKMYWSGGGSFRYALIDSFVGNNNPPMSAGSYGLEVYNSSGPGNGNVLFSTNASRMVSVLDIGYFGSTEGTVSIPIPATVHPNNVFVLLNGTSYYYAAGVGWPFNGDLENNVNYEFDFSGTTKYVRVRNFLRVIQYYSENVIILPAYAYVPYMIVTILGDVMD